MIDADTVTRTVFQDAQDYFKRLHMFDFLHEFYMAKDLKISVPGGVGRGP